MERSKLAKQDSPTTSARMGNRLVARLRATLACSLMVFAAACGGDDEVEVERPEAPTGQTIYNVANGCFSIDATRPGSDNTRWLVADETNFTFAFTGLEDAEGARFLLRPSDLGTYLLYDADGNYVVYAPLADGDVDGVLVPASQLESDIQLLDDTFRSPAEWELQVSANDATRFQLRHYATGQFLTREGLTDDESEAAVIALYPKDSSECAEFPEMSLDAQGAVEPRQWPDGDVYGIVDSHSHLLTNFGFGGGGIFHGAPFHRLGVEHALPSCELYHGPEGRKDVVGYAFGANSTADFNALLELLTNGETPEFNHYPDGYPNFVDWPSSYAQATHQMQYYKWLERAYLSGLRLVVQHATTNSVLCDLVVGLDSQDVRYSCNDMVNVDRQLEEARNMERYIDAQSGGPGQGWFRIVTSPADAREVINQGKLAVVLGIETSNLFDCFLTPPSGVDQCTAADVRDALDYYYDLGVRVMFPAHKFDNAFAAGDGDRRVGQIGSLINSGHRSNFVDDCPDVPSVFDKGDVSLGGLNEPREEYFAAPDYDFSRFAENPLRALLPLIADFQEPPLRGEYCQNAGLTDLGRTLLTEMMDRGMVIEVDHLPKRGYQQAYELLVENDYPASGSHGNTNRGLIYQLGGISKTGFNGCGSVDTPGTMASGFLNRLQQIEENGGYVAEGFGFDFNGFAGGRRPRFGENSSCPQPQANPVEYPFDSYAGDITFTEPHLGSRTVDFNTEGMLHLGLLPELIEDVRRDGVPDEAIEPLFRSAEAYLRTWERSEQRAAELRSAR